MILVDNASTDNSLIDARIVFKGLKIIENKKNLGFAGGNNVGINAANGKYVIFLNYDTVVDKHWLTEMVTTMESEDLIVDGKQIDGNIGIVQSKVMLHGTDLINTSGGNLNFLGFGWCKDYKKTEITDEPIFYSSGSALMIRKKILDIIGGFDEDFFMYHEDTDMSWNTRLLGYDVVVSPKAIVHHKYQFNRKTKDKFYYLERNRYMTILKNYSLKTLLLITPAILITEPAVFVYFMMSGNVKEKLRVNWYILRNFGKIMKKRKRIQQMRERPDRGVMKLMKAGIEFEEVDNPMLKYILNPFLSVYFKVMRVLV